MEGRPRQRAIVVLGPGRCGTSTIARGLIALGIAFGDRLKPAARKNPRGFFEDLDLLAINYEAHARLGLRRNGSSVSWISDEAWKAADLDDLQRRAQEVIRRRFGGAPIWGCKIGGMMRILPFWERVFEQEALDIAYVLAIRHPASVARSRTKLDPHRSIGEKSDLEFAAQILPFVADAMRRACVVVDYDRVMADPAREMQRVALRLGLPLSADVKAGIAAYADGFVNTALRHHEAGSLAAAVMPLTWHLYRHLSTLAGHEPTVGHPAITGDLAAMTAEFKAMAPTLRLIDELEDRLRRRGPTLRSLFFAIYSHLPTRRTLKDIAALSLAASIGRRSSQPRHADRP